MKKLLFTRRNDAGHWVGDGFPVRGIFSYNDIAQEMSPFLLMDYAGPAMFTPTTKRRGVGDHPHRGFETVTIVYAGEVDHRDSAGGGGSIGPGDVQWMTAGSGLVHQEFHGEHYAAKGGPFEMIQLWVNLPATHKMTAPGYQSITDAQIPRVALPGDAGTVRVIAGEYLGQTGPAHTFTPMHVWDVRAGAGKHLEFTWPEGHTSAVFVLKGALRFADTVVGEAELAVLEREGDKLVFDVVEDATLLMLNGQPLNEPIVGYGPFVMNTEDEIRQAFSDFKNGRMGRIA